MVVAGEKGTQGTVDETRCEDLIVAGLAFTLGEAAGETTCRSILLFVLHCQGHKIGTWSHGTSCTNGGKKHSATHAKFNGTIGLLRYLTRLEGDGTSITQGNRLLDWVNQIVYHKI